MNDSFVNMSSPATTLAAPGAATGVRAGFSSSPSSVSEASSSSRGPPKRRRTSQASTAIMAENSALSATMMSASSSTIGGPHQKRNVLTQEEQDRRNDPRPFVLGLPRTTENTRRRAQHQRDLLELTQRQDQGAVIGAEMDERNELIASWAAGAHARVHVAFAKTNTKASEGDHHDDHDVDDEQQQQQQSSYSPESWASMLASPLPQCANCGHFLVVASELYVRQLLSLHRAEVEADEARQWREMMFERRREVFVFSAATRRTWKKFVRRWAAVRHAKHYAAQLARDSLELRRELSARRDIENEYDSSVAGLMMDITVQLAWTTKMRLVAFLLSLQRGIWTGRMCILEAVERTNMLWGDRAPDPPQRLLEAALGLQQPIATATSSAASATASAPVSSLSSSPIIIPAQHRRGLLASMICAEQANREIILYDQLSERELFSYAMQRCTLEFALIHQKEQEQLEEVQMRDSLLLPRTQSLLHYYTRRDLEEREWSTRLVVEVKLLRECDKDIEQHIRSIEDRSQAIIFRAWRRYIGAKKLAAMHVEVMREVMRQERDDAIVFVREEILEQFSESCHGRLEWLIEPTLRSHIVATWEKTMLLAASSHWAAAHEIVSDSFVHFGGARGASPSRRGATSEQASNSTTTQTQKQQQGESLIEYAEQQSHFEWIAQQLAQRHHRDTMQRWLCEEQELEERRDIEAVAFDALLTTGAEGQWRSNLLSRLIGLQGAAAAPYTQQQDDAAAANVAAQQEPQHQKDDGIALDDGLGEAKQQLAASAAQAASARKEHDDDDILTTDLDADVDDEL